jgi:hypothetical protein
MPDAARVASRLGRGRYGLTDERGEESAHRRRARKVIAEYHEERLRLLLDHVPGSVHAA